MNDKIKKNLENGDYETTNLDDHKMYFKDLGIGIEKCPSCGCKEYYIEFHDEYEDYLCFGCYKQLFRKFI